LYPGAATAGDALGGRLRQTGTRAGARTGTGTRTGTRANTGAKTGAVTDAGNATQTS